MPLGTVTVPLFARWNGEEYPVGDLTFEVGDSTEETIANFVAALRDGE